MISVPTNSTVAYFSMEIALDKAIPTYSGGLGVLAGDTLRSAADLGVPIVGVTLLHRKGYFEQHLDATAIRPSSPSTGVRRTCSSAVDARASTVVIEGRTVHVRAWKYPGARRQRARSPGLPARHAAPRERRVRSHAHRLRSTAATTTIASARRSCSAWAARRCSARSAASAETLPPERRPLGAAHAVSARVAARRPQSRSSSMTPTSKRCAAAASSRRTRPCPPGHDKFPIDMVAPRARRRARRAARGGALRRRRDAQHDAPRAAPRAVRQRRGDAAPRSVARACFPNFPIDSITNGVHAGTWTSPPFQALFDRRIPEWRRDNLYLRYAVGIPLQEIRDAHAGSEEAR